MLAKKKKGFKPPKGAAAALEALDQWDAANVDDDPLAPVAPQPIKKKLKKKDLLAKQAAEAEAAAPAATVAAATPAATTAAPLPPPAILTMAQKVKLICAELGLDEGLPVGAAVKEANEAMGLEPAGPMLAQVEALAEQLGLSFDQPAAAAPTPPPPPPVEAPTVVSEAAAAEEEPAVAEGAAAAEEEPAVAEGAADASNAEAEGAAPALVEESATLAEAVEVEPAPVASAGSAEDEDDNNSGDAPAEVRLSKKKQGKAKEDKSEEELAAAEAVAAEGRDASGRRGMGVRVEQFADAPPGFAYVKMQEGKLRFRNQDVLTDASWDVQTGQRVGLVGNNGAGKTTQLRVLAREQELDSGELLTSSSDIKVAFLRQEFREELRDGRTLREELVATFTEVGELQTQYAAAEAALAGSGDDADAMQAALDAMAELQAKLDAAGASSLEARADRMMASMGFTATDAELPVSAFSGGWKMRIGLAKALLKEPQVLLLDEPTNHMDLDSVEWLERYLNEQTEKLALVIVSHDREFLDRVCTKIVETEYGKTYSYTGNYRAFLRQKEARVALATDAWEKQRKEVKALKADIQKLRKIESAAATVRQKERQIAAMEPGGTEHLVKPYAARAKFSFRFPPAPRCSPEVLELEDVAHGYGEGADASTLFRDVNLCIEKGDRVAIVGPNGAGKSTLMRLIMGTEAPRSGRAEIVAANAVVKYFEQDQANVLPLDKSVMETLQAAASETHHEYEELRALLGRFMFKDEKVNDKLSTLSGGEKARVALCCMMLEPSNVLLLDEPTNHLDIAAKEVLEEAIQFYEGTVVTVSHDRFFLSQTATTILAVEDSQLVVYDGDFKTYMERNEGVGEKVEKRYITGGQKIRSAPRIDVEPEEQTTKKKKNFGGRGGPSGNLNKGVKNAKRQAATM